MEALDELQEHSHDASSGFDKRMAVTMAVIAAALAIVSVLGQMVIVFASLAILTKRTFLWMTAIESALIGMATAATGAFVK